MLFRSLAANDTDPEGDLIRSSLTLTGTGPSHGSVLNLGDGTVSYTPDADYHGADSFSYTICDGAGLCDGATVSVTVTPVNDAPAAQDDTATTDEDTSVVIDVLANDWDIDGDSLTVVSVSDPANGTAVVNPNGTVTYRPDPGFTGTDTFEYLVGDGNGGTDTGLVTVVVNPVVPGNDAPTANDDTATTNEDTSVVIDLAVNDSDADDGLDLSSLSIISGPTNGSLVVNPDGTVDYTHDGSETISDSFTYTIDDNSGTSSNVATVNLTINQIGRAHV